MIKRFLKDVYWGKLDYLVIDTPPGTSDEHLSIVAALKSASPDGAVIVTTPQRVALATVRKEVRECLLACLLVLGSRCTADTGASVSAAELLYQDEAGCAGTH